MTAERKYRVLRLIEVAELSPEPGLARLRGIVSSIGDPRVEVLPCSPAMPWLLVCTRDCDTRGLLALLPDDACVSATELRARVELAESPAESLRSLIQDAGSRHALALGRAAVERAAQRRRLDLIVVAADIDSSYADSLERILTSTAAGIQVFKVQETARDLGALTGTKRAGVLGFLRGGTLLQLTGQARQYHGRDVSSVPGSPSSALSHLNSHNSQ